MQLAFIMLADALCVLLNLFFIIVYIVWKPEDASHLKNNSLSFKMRETTDFSLLADVHLWTYLIASRKL